MVKKIVMIAGARERLLCGLVVPITLKLICCLYLLSKNPKILHGGYIPFRGKATYVFALERIRRYFQLVGPINTKIKT